MAGTYSPLSGNRDRRLIEESKRRFHAARDKLVKASTVDGPPPGTVAINDPQHQLERLQRAQATGKVLTADEQRRMLELQRRLS